jgi:hypothetical protein
MPRNKECDQLVPDVLGGETSACFWIAAFQHSIQQVTLVFTAILPLFDQLPRVSIFSHQGATYLICNRMLEGHVLFKFFVCRAI